MRQSAHFSSSIADYLAKLGSDSARLALRIADDVVQDLPRYSSKNDKYSEKHISIYFFLYTLPVIEAAHLIEEDRFEEAVFWSKVQSYLGMHLRYTDDILDIEVSPSELPIAFINSRTYLFEAQKLLLEANRSWGPQQESVYAQFLAYEAELNVGLTPHFDTQWRRVSPLCVVPKTYLHDMLTADFLRRFDRYLAWSLAHADCADLLSDLNQNRDTPVGKLAREIAGSGRLGISAGWVAHCEAKDFLSRIGGYRQEDAPLWAAAIDFLEFAYGCESDAVDT